MNIYISDSTLNQVKSLYLQIKDIANTHANNGVVDLPLVYDQEYLIFFLYGQMIVQHKN